MQSVKIFYCYHWEKESLKVVNFCTLKCTARFIKVSQLQKLQISLKNHKLRLNSGFWNTSEAQILKLRLTQLKVKSFQWETKRTELKDTLTSFLTSILWFQQWPLPATQNIKNDRLSSDLILYEYVYIFYLYFTWIVKYFKYKNWLFIKKLLLNFDRKMLFN